MVNYKNSTTNFYHPDMTRKLQASGAFIVFDGGRRMEGFLVDSTGEHYLTGNVAWLQKTCDVYRIKTVRLDLWRKLTDDPVPTALFQTDFGARILEDAFGMRALGMSTSLVKPHAPSLIDNYTNAEDAFIDQNGFSSGLD